MILDFFVGETPLMVRNTEDGPYTFRKYFIVTIDRDGVFRASPELYYFESEAEAAIANVTPEQVANWIELPPEPSVEERFAEDYRLEQEARRYGEW